MGQKNPKEPSGRSNSLGECYRRRNVNQLAQRTNSINAPRFRNVLDSSHLWLGAQGAQPQWWKGVYFTKGGRPSPRQHCCAGRLDAGPNSTQVDGTTAQWTHSPAACWSREPCACPPHTHTLCPPELRGRHAKGRASLELPMWNWQSESQKQKQARTTDLTQCSISHYSNQTKCLLKFVIQKMYSLLNEKKLGREVLEKEKRLPFTFFSQD